MTREVWFDKCPDCGGRRRNELVLVDACSLARLEDEAAAATHKRNDPWITVFGVLLVVAIFVIWGLVESKASRGRALPAGPAVPRLA